MTDAPKSTLADLELIAGRLRFQLDHCPRHHWRTRHELRQRYRAAYQAWRAAGGTHI